MSSLKEYLAYGFWPWEYMFAVAIGPFLAKSPPKSLLLWWESVNRASRNHKRFGGGKVLHEVEAIYNLLNG